MTYPSCVICHTYTNVITDQQDARIFNVSKLINRICYACAVNPQIRIPAVRQQSAASN